MSYLGYKANLTPISPLGQAATSSRVRTGLTGRENATMLFAAGVDVFASMGCSSEQVSVTIVITRQNQSTPKVEVRGVEPLSEPIRKVTYPQRGCHQTDLNRRPWLYKSPALPLCYDGMSIRSGNCLRPACTIL